MRYVAVTIHHEPDAGQHSSSHFSYQDFLGHTDLVTVRGFAFKALAEEHFLKGRIEVVFPEAASRFFRFERMGLVGYKLEPDRTKDVVANQRTSTGDNE